jgi:hypothetical protein
MAGVARAVRERRARLGLNLTECPFYTPPLERLPSSWAGPRLWAPYWVDFHLGSAAGQAGV